MNKQKILKGLISLIVIVIIAITASFISAKKTTQEVEKIFENANKSMTIDYLYQVRGRVSEIKYLSYDDIPQDILLEELESISSLKFSDEMYLDDFVLTSSTTSDIGAICEEYTSQIDEKIAAIKHDE